MIAIELLFNDQAQARDKACARADTNLWIELLFNATYQIFGPPD